MTYRPRRLAPFFAVFAIASAVLVLPFGCMVARPYSDGLPRRFSASAWQAAPAAFDGETRCRMLLDLQVRVGLVGRSRREIVALLGPADGENRGGANSYWLLCPSFLDVYILVVSWRGEVAVAAGVADT